VLQLDDCSFLGCRVNDVGQRGKMPLDAVWKIKTDRGYLKKGSVMNTPRPYSWRSHFRMLRILVAP